MGAAKSSVEYIIPCLLFPCLILEAVVVLSFQRVL
jgi:hypothetical protein